MKKFLLELKEVTSKYGTCVGVGDDTADAVGAAHEYFNQGPNAQVTKPTELWWDSTKEYSFTEVTAKREITPPGPYIVYWRFPGDPDDLEVTFETYGMAEMMAEGIKKTLPDSIGHIEFVDELQYEGDGDWAWSPSIQMSWGEE